MLTVEEIKNVQFSRAVGGYKADDVDVFLDKIEADYAAFQRIIKDYELKVETLNSEIEGFKSSQSSIQNVLVSAQGLADRIVKEAKEKSEEIIKQAEGSISAITAHEKELSAAFELKAQEQKGALEKELTSMVEAAQKKADAITAAAEDKVRQQQMLFDRLKLEISAFKAGVTAKYKEHIELLSKLPDTVSLDPKYIAQVTAQDFTDSVAESELQEEKAVEEISSTAKEDETGFVIGEIEAQEEE